MPLNAACTPPRRYARLVFALIRVLWYHINVAGGRVTYREVVKRLRADGWYVERISGSHVQLRHPSKPGTVTVPGGGKGGEMSLSGR